MTARLCELDHRAAGDAVQEAVRRRSMDLAVLHDEEHVGSGRFRHQTAVVQHQGVVEALLLRFVLGHGADHVKTCCLGMHGGGVRSRAAPFRQGQPDALHLGFRVEIGGPFPSRDRQMNGVVLCGNTHHLTATPGYRTHVAVGNAHGGDRLALRGLDFGDRKGDLEIQRRGGFVEPLGVFQRFEHTTVINAFALEHGTGIMQPMTQDMQLGVAPWDGPLAVVEWNQGHANVPYLSRAVLRTSVRATLVNTNGPKTVSEGSFLTLNSSHA